VDAGAYPFDHPAAPHLLRPDRPAAAPDSAASAPADRQLTIRLLELHPVLVR